MAKPAIAFLLGLLLDLAGALIVAFFASDANKTSAFFFTFVILIVGQFVFGFWRLAKYWLMFFVFAKSKMTRFYLAEFHRLELPGAQKFFNAGDYLASLMDDERIPSKTKQRLEYFRGEIDGMKALQPLTHGLGMELAFENAVSQYHVPAEVLGRNWNNVEMDE